MSGTELCEALRLFDGETPVLLSRYLSDGSSVVLPQELRRS